MPFARPNLLTLRTQAMQDIVASDLPNADGFLRRAALRVLAWVQAGLAHLHYGYLDWIARMGVPFTAEDEFLEAWAAFAPTPVLRETPQPATGQAAWTGSPVGADLPAGTGMQRGDGVAYVTTADATVQIGDTVTAPIVAVIPGSAGNADIGTPLTLTIVVEGINSAGAATTVITGGTDLEQDDPLRTRMLESYAAPPHGGNAADYVTWALDLVPGVTRAWVRRNGMGAGTVVVYFMRDAADLAFGGFPQGTNGVATLETRDTPATGDQLALANAIFPVQPVPALVYAAAPSPQSRAFTISGLVGTTTAQKAAVSVALTGMLQLKGSPLADTPIQQSDVDAAISAIPGLPTFAITAPSSWPITPSLGNIFTLGVVTYI
jgi:uncharacterized phage protein gp47/JayE